MPYVSPWERKVRRDELQILRFWIPFHKSPIHMNRADDHLSKRRLCITELYCLNDLREKHDRKKVEVPDVRGQWDEFKHHFDAYDRVLRVGRAKLEVMEDGVCKSNGLHNWAQICEVHEDLKELAQKNI